MSNQAALHPRFSVKASFAGNIIDASDNEYATQKARNYPKSSGRCVVNVAQPQVEVQAAPARRLQELGIPTQEGKQYWGGRTVVYQPRKTDADIGQVTNTPVNRQQVRTVAPQQRQAVKAKGVTRQVVQQQIQPKVVNRQTVAAPVPNPNNRAFGQKMGQREVAIQKAQRQARHGEAVVEQNANSFVATVPHELLEGDSFILEMPQGAWSGNVVRPHELAQEADRYADQELEDHDATEEAAAVVNRNHWRGKTIVQRGVQRCAAVQQPARQVVSGPGCQARQQALKKGEATVRAVPKKIVPRQQVVQQQVQAKRRNEPAKKSGGCPCNK
jgi:hypothetical protein